MALQEFTEIPDVKYTVTEDGNLVNIEQGYIEPVYVQLHKIHIKHFAEVMKIGIEEDKTAPMLVDFLERINEQAESLYNYLASVPCFPTNTQLTEDVIMAKSLYETANKALAYWGSN
jgi:hypothetical protein